MSRYEAQEILTGAWLVFDTGTPSARYSESILTRAGTSLTEAEARIIAFALNAVAEGRSLWALDRPRDGNIGKNTRYDGPTEGVAP